ncbi:hypothetical protein ISREJYDI_CDS0131 [Pseudomonas phage UNO-G1W1]|uniref:Uncharacterized protein n=1 Tax=Pseudomonas phage UNO-G1W1 TaxID=3136609 RepID=A0AAX4QMI7_9CAUD
MLAECNLNLREAWMVDSRLRLRLSFEYGVSLGKVYLPIQNSSTR